MKRIKSTTIRIAGQPVRQPGERFSAILDGDTVMLSPEELREILEWEAEVTA